jgi:hypothetical protein
MILVLVTNGCGGAGERTSLADEGILAAAVPGTANSRIDSQTDSRVVRLMDVTGDWNQVSVDIARLARQHGWNITSVNCVGTGNDVIAYKEAGDEVWLLESGAGTRGAGLIVSVVGSAASGFTVGGRCPLSLIEEAAE